MYTQAFSAIEPEVDRSEKYKTDANEKEVRSSIYVINSVNGTYGATQSDTSSDFELSDYRSIHPILPTWDKMSLVTWIEEF